MNFCRSAMKNPKRRIMYYLPLINVAGEIRGADFLLRAYSAIDDYHSLMPSGIFNEGGSVIEVSGFSSGDSASEETDRKVFETLERIKFAYFFANPAIPSDIRGYVSSESFECFRLVERNGDAAFEHKISISNGMYDFFHSMDSYYQFRCSLKIRGIRIAEKDLPHVDQLAEVHVDPRLLSAMRLYNRCWETYSIHNHFDKALLARASIEAFAPAVGLDNKTYADGFWSAATESIESSANSNWVEKMIWEELVADRDRLKLALFHHLEGLRAARHSLVHEGKEVPDYRNLPFYLIWFPLFWVFCLKRGSIADGQRLRLILFLALLKHEPDKWTVMEMRGITIRRSDVDMYCHYARVVPKLLRENDETRARQCVAGIVNWIRSGA